MDMGQPQQVRQPQNNSQDQVPSQVPSQTPPSDSGHWWQPTLASKIVVGLLVVAAVLLLLASIAGLLIKKPTEASFVKSDQHQAVFLSNGQVYFGSITSISDELFVLEDIFYLQVDQQIQPEQDESEAEQPNVSLAKLGNELHGPEDQMFISAEEVIFWENLKDESQVSQAIKAYEPGQPATDDSAAEDTAAEDTDDSADEEQTP